MIAIITGDIINSRKVDVNQWLTALKLILQKYGKEPSAWQIYRGDSFQLKIKPIDAILAVLLIKSSIKQFNKLDVRIAIGIGEISYEAKKITESNGTAFINSGECFEQLKKQTLGIKSPWKDFDDAMNIMFDLASVTMDNWTNTSSEIIKNALENPEMSQKKLAAKLNKKSQGTISEGLKRGGFDEIKKLINYYQKEIKKLC
jgi:hypothetical protein